MIDPSNNSPAPLPGNQTSAPCALPGFTSPVSAINPGTPKANEIQSDNKPAEKRSIIETLNDPSGIMDPISAIENQTEPAPAKKEAQLIEVKLEDAVKEIKKVQEAEDYRMAQALHLQINNTAPPVSSVGSQTIQRLIEKGIAVNALTGH